MQAVFVGRRHKLIQRTNPNIFLKNPNTDKKFGLTPEDYNDPHSIIPSKLYNDFNRGDYQRHTLTFPIKVPTWYKVRRVESQIARREPVRPNVPNYAHLTGNQLLLSLLRYEELDPQELSEIFFQLSMHPDARDLNLEANRIIQPVIGWVAKHMSTWTLDHLMKTLYSMFRLGFNDIELWSRARKNLMDKIYGFINYSTTCYAQLFVIMFDKFGDIMTPAERELLVTQLPRYLHKMHHTDIARMFTLCMNLGVIKSNTDYLFEYHFMMIFWKFPGQFSLTEAADILEGLNKLQHFNDDKKFYEVEFIPRIMKKMILNNNNKELARFLEVIEPLKYYGIDEQLINDWCARIQARLMYVERKLHLVDKSQFVDIVRDDLRRFREKTLAEKEAKKKAAGEKKAENSQEMA